MKATQSLLKSPGRLVLSLLLGMLTAWLLRSEVTMLLLGKDFAGRSLPVQAAVLGASALAATLLWAAFLHSYGGGLAGVLKGLPGWVHSHPEIILVLFFSLVARFFLADWNSYWYDELVEVQTASGEGNSATAIARSMMGTDRHPPLYQISLFFWMRLFGNSEVSTRMLSTLLVTLAVLLLYLFAERLYGKRTADAAALFFTLSNMAVAYSLESRAYALTLFLCCLSSYVLLRYLSSLNGVLSWRGLLLNRWYILLVVTNAALPLTHYYNAYFLAAQALFVLFLAFSWQRGRGILPVLIKVSALYAVQLAVFLILWGGAFIQAFGIARHRAGQPEHPCREPVQPVRRVCGGAQLL